MSIELELYGAPKFVERAKPGHVIEAPHNSDVARLLFEDADPTGIYGYVMGLLVDDLGSISKGNILVGTIIPPDLRQGHLKTLDQWIDSEGPFKDIVRPQMYRGPLTVIGEITYSPEDVKSDLFTQRLREGSLHLSDGEDRARIQRGLIEYDAERDVSGGFLIQVPGGATYPLEQVKIIPKPK